MTQLFDYLTDNIKINEQVLFKEKRQTHNLDRIFKVVEKFIIDKKLICYGGTALNNILPLDRQFYNYDLTSPDYDFFSTTAYEDVLLLANIFKEKGYENIRAKSAIHDGTYKLYVNYVPVADITQMNSNLFNQLSLNTVVRDKINYSPIHFLIMSMHLELSRPRGDLTRWEKILKRLNILNDAYPFTITKCETNINFDLNIQKDKSIFSGIQSILVKESSNIIFIGEYAINQYSQFFTKQYQTIIQKNNKPTFVILHNEPNTLIHDVRNKYTTQNVINKKIDEIDDVIPEINNIFIDNSLYLVVIKPTGCQNYNSIIRNGQTYHIGTIDTILYYYFLMIYVEFQRQTTFYDNLMCIAFLMFNIQNKIINKKSKLLNRFNLSCIGNQVTFEDIIDKKRRKYDRLKHNKQSLKYKKSFLDYVPRTKKNKTLKKKSKSKSKKLN